ncbi:MAG: ribonuclease HII [Candidatus Margulisiibacteriota bacterium]
MSDKQNRVIAGVDEAGRGALAGPVVACCVVLKPSFKLQNEVNDSKRLSEKRRNGLFTLLLNDIHLGIGINSHRYITKHNVLKATMVAMATSIRKNKGPYNHIIIDGNKAPINGDSIETLVKADSKIIEVMVASICAKVIRDRLMKKYSRLYTGYGFEIHKGYGTKRHFEALFDNGPCPVHRTSFNLNKQLTLFN